GAAAFAVAFEPSAIEIGTGLQQRLRRLEQKGEDRVYLFRAGRRLRRPVERLGNLPAHRCVELRRGAEQYRRTGQLRQVGRTPDLQQVRHGRRKRRVEADVETMPAIADPGRYQIAPVEIGRQVGDDRAIVEDVERDRLLRARLVTRPAGNSP